MDGARDGEDLGQRLIFPSRDHNNHYETRFGLLVQLMSAHLHHRIPWKVAADEAAVVQSSSRGRGQRLQGEGAPSGGGASFTAKLLREAGTRGQALRRTIRAVGHC